MTIYYVSSEIGNNNNGGTSQSAPLASLQAAANVVKPGDTVQVMNGTYTAPSYEDALDITTSGTASAPITFEAAPGQTPVIDSSGGWNAINVKASYIVIKGFTIVGDAADYNLQSALAGYSVGSSNLDGNGIAVNSTTSVPLPNHITIENNTVYNEPGGGIYTEGADYVQILNNVVHNNANWSAYGNSGISISTSANSDTASGPHDVVSGNLVYGNAQLVPTNGDGEITDGEGIILDTNPNYTSEILVENNTVYSNGGPGIESFLTANAVITGNTVYGNDTQNTQAQDVAEIFINQSSNNSVSNNKTSNPNVTVPVVSSGAVNANDSVTLAGTAVAGSTVTVLDGTTTLGNAVASANGSWSFTTLILAGGAHAFTATDTISVGTSAASTTFNLTVPTNAANTQTPAAPVISKATVNSNDSITLTGTAVANSTVTVLSVEGVNDGTTTASSTGAWSFTTPVLDPSNYGYVATDTTPGGTSVKTAEIAVTVSATTTTTTGTGSSTVAAPVISKATVNSNDSVTLTGTAVANSTVTVWSAEGVNDGTTTASSTGAWSFTTPALNPANYGYTATDTTSAGTSGHSAEMAVTVSTVTATGNPPTAPVISKATVNSNDSVTLAGTAVANSTVTVWSAEGVNDGTTTASSAGAWSFTTPVLGAANYGYSATDTTSAGTSAHSAEMAVTVPTVTATSNPPAAPTIPYGVVNSNDSVTLTGTAPAGSIVTVSDGGANSLGTATSSSSFVWSFTTAVLAAGSYAFTATDTTAAGTSVKSSALDVTVPTATATATATSNPPAAPVISKAAVNSNDSVTLTGTAVANSTVTVWSVEGVKDGTTTASSAGAWSFTTPVLGAANYGYTATDTTSAGTSGHSAEMAVKVSTVTATSNPPAAPTIPYGVVNSNHSVTLTGTAPAGSIVAVSDGGANSLGTATSSSSFVWSFTTAVLAAGPYAFTATDTTAAGTSVKSSALDVTVPTATATATATSNPPAAPVISKATVNSNDSVTLTGTAVANSTVTVWSVEGVKDGTTTASSAGAWSFTTPALDPANYGYVATDTTPGGTSAKTAEMAVTAPTQSFSANGRTYGVEVNVSATSDELDLSASAVTVTRGSGTESLQAGSSNFPFNSSDYRSTETIDAQPSDHFVFNSGFGHETIEGFQALGSGMDTLQLSMSSFSYLNAGMSQAADLAALLMHSSGGTSATTITDSSGDTLTLAGLSRTTIAADAATNPSLVKFV